jgi:hypothetical protein
MVPSGKRGLISTRGIDGHDMTSHWSWVTFMSSMSKRTGMWNSPETVMTWVASGATPNVISPVLLST